MVSLTPRQRRAGIAVLVVVGLTGGVAAVRAFAGGHEGGGVPGRALTRTSSTQVTAGVGWTRRWTAAPGGVVDAAGNQWEGDAGVVQGGAAPKALAAGSAEPYRYARAGQPVYSLPVPEPGTYAVVLSLAAPEHGAAPAASVTIGGQIVGGQPGAGQTGPGQTGVGQTGTGQTGTGQTGGAAGGGQTGGGTGSGGTASGWSASGGAGSGGASGGGTGSGGTASSGAGSGGAGSGGASGGGTGSGGTATGGTASSGAGSGGAGSGGTATGGVGGGGAGGGGQTVKLAATGAGRVRHAVVLIAVTGDTARVAVGASEHLAGVSAVTLIMARTDTGPLRAELAEEFDGAAGTALLPGWRHDTGAGGWGNGELQEYTERAENAALTGDGRLAVAARADGGAYTSARLKSAYSGLYGRIEGALQVPDGRGLLPAFWMLGADTDTVGWPKAGEVDLMESLGGAEPGVVHGTVHGPDGSARGWERAFTAKPGGGPDKGVHRYELQWWPGVLQWSVDGVVQGVLRREDLGAKQEWVFERPAYLLLDVAVGGRWPGAPPASTSFPQTMYVDSVHWWR